MAGKSEFSLVVLVMILSSLIQIRTERCTFIRTLDTRGLGDGLFKDFKSLDQCEHLCAVDNSCVAVYQYGPICYFALSKQTKTETGTEHSLKSCTDDTTPEPTTPEPTTPKPTTPKPAKPATPKPATPEPTTPKPELTTTTPKLTTPKPTTPEPTTASSNQGNSQQGTCIFIRTLDTRGLGDGAFKELKTFDACQQLCVADNSCVAVYRIGPICYFALNKQTGVSNKYCTDDKTPEPVTTELTIPETTTLELIMPKPNTHESTTLNPRNPEPTMHEAKPPGTKTPESAIPEPAPHEPVIPEPATPEPANADPVIPEPATQEPATQEPAIPEPVTPEPATPEPGIPEPTTPEPTTPEPTTFQKTTLRTVPDGSQQGRNGGVQVKVNVLCYLSLLVLMLFKHVLC